MDLEDAVVQLARLGLKGDTRSVNRYVRRLLRGLASNGSVDARTKQALANLISQQPSPAMRFVDEGIAATSQSLVNVDAHPSGDAPLLSQNISKRVDAIVNEHLNAERLGSIGLEPTRTVLLTGPPGVGKTMTARALARRLDIPLFSVNLSTLVSSYLGKTGQNLRDVFSTARETRSVLLLDEFDAIAKRRDDPSDVGELKRIVNVLLLELETWAPSGLVVGATNHPELLDRAVWRRFDTTIEIGLPELDIRRGLLARHLETLQHPVSANVLDVAAEATEGISGSDIGTLVRACVRDALLRGRDITDVLAEETLHRLRRRAESEAEARTRYCQLASSQLGLSQRAIGAQLGVSHVTVGKLIRKTKRRRKRRTAKETSHG